MCWRHDQVGIGVLKTYWYIAFKLLRWWIEKGWVGNKNKEYRQKGSKKTFGFEGWWVVGWKLECHPGENDGY